MNEGSSLVDESVAPSLNANDPQPADVAAFESKANGTVKMIPVALIRKNDVALRDVRRDDEAYQTLLQSIKKRGVLNSILVREQRAPDGTVTYGLIDGLQRYSCVCDAGQVEIPARIVDMDEAELLEAQIITNVNRIETKPAEYSKHLVRILARNPFMTTAQLADKICQSKGWLEERLSLTDLHPEAQKLVDAGIINLSNAYALAKIPEKEQLEHLDAAKTEPYTTFVPRMKARVKEIREAKKAGRDAGAAEFKPTQYMQKLATIKEELDKKAVATALLTKNGLTSEEALKAWNLCLAWVMHFDADSQEEQKRDYEARKAKAAENREKAKAEREATKAQKEAQAAVSVEKGW